MTLNYINNPVIKKHKIKELIKIITEEGIPHQWVIIDTTKDKTLKEYRNMYNRYGQHRKRYINFEWAIHHGDDNYSIICRKIEPKQ